MSDNSTEIVQQIRMQFEALLARVQSSTAEPPTAYEMERSLVTDLLELGRLLLQCYFCSQHAALQSVASVELGDKRLPLHGLKQRSVRSVFGKIRFVRGYYYAVKQGYYLLDARLNLPMGCTSDLLREWRSTLACYNAYHKTDKTLHSIIGQRHSARAIEDDISCDSKLASAFAEQHLPPEPSSEDSVLVIQADGKGVPMVGQKNGAKRVRLGKGEKSGRKKEAIATSVYTLEPCVRTPQQVTESLFKCTSPIKCNTSPTVTTGEKRKRPSNKWLWATFDGKAAAVAFAKKQVTKREGKHITARVALTDGAAPLQNQILKQLPDYTLILDVIHAIEYVWKAANGLYGEKSPKRETWVRERVMLMLSGKTQQIIDEFRKLATAPGCKKRAISTLLSTASYFERNLPYMRYEVYLENGWPIGTGVIEGACRHLIKDRCELSGMRWTISGAEALLHLRSIAENKSWEQFEAYRQDQRKRIIYGNIGKVGKCTTIELAGTQVREVIRDKRAA